MRNFGKILTHMIAYIVHLIFYSYTILLLVRILGSWFPQFQGSKIMRFVAHYTDPYLNVFRRLIPPIGGVLDLSPLLAFFSVKIMEAVILGLLPA